MKIKYMSDLHLEFGQLKIENDPDDYKNTILVLAGDIAPIDRRYHSMKYFLEDCSELFYQVILIAGNHCFYHGEMINDTCVLKDLVSNFDNVTFLENETVKFGDINFIGATLWTSFFHNNPMEIIQAKESMNDLRIIDYDVGEKFTTGHWKTLNLKSYNYIFNKLKDLINEKTVVITHHAPSYQSISEAFRGSSLNGSYCNEYDLEIEKYKPNFWIHGHMHQSFDYIIGETRVLCNSRGYYPYQLNPLFDQRKYFTL